MLAVLAGLVAQSEALPDSSGWVFIALPVTVAVIAFVAIRFLR